MSIRYGCHGGSLSTGFAGGTSMKVHFSLKSNDASIATAAQVAERFYSLFNSFEPCDHWSKAQIALRFQNFKKANGRTESGGEKVVRFAFWRIPKQGPTNEVPGHLPGMGAASAFGWSRRMRRRINSATAPSQPTPEVWVGASSSQVRRRDEPTSHLNHRLFPGPFD